MRYITGLLLALTLGGQALADTRYIRDTVFVPVRTGAGSQYRIIHQGLRSGTALQVLEISGDYARISTGRLEGWLPAQYLVSEPPASVRLETAQKQALALQAEATQLRTSLRTLEEQKRLLETQSQDAAQQALRATEELAEIRKISDNAIQLNDNNRTLVQENELLRTQVGVLSSEVDRLKQRTAQEWFLNGVFAVGFGVVLALLIPRLIPRRRRTDWK